MRPFNPPFPTLPPPPVEKLQLSRAEHGQPEGAYFVDAEALRQARQNTPKGEYHCQ